MNNNNCRFCQKICFVLHKGPCVDIAQRTLLGQTQLFSRKKRCKTNIPERTREPNDFLSFHFFTKSPLLAQVLRLAGAESSSGSIAETILSRWSSYFAYTWQGEAKFRYRTISFAQLLWVVFAWHNSNAHTKCLTSASFFENWPICFLLSSSFLDKMSDLAFPWGSMSGVYEFGSRR